MIKYSVFEDGLKRLEADGLLRRVRDRASAQGRTIIIGEREYLNFASNDYLGLAAHPKVVKAAEKALGEYGFGAGASRLLSGGCGLHGELERRLASFKGTEGALLFNSGYAANTGAIPAIYNHILSFTNPPSPPLLKGEKGGLNFIKEGGGLNLTEGLGGTKGSVTLLCDRLNHASLIDACRLSKAEMLIYRHCDTGHLEGLLKKSGAEVKIVVTDTVFSMDGDVVPLPEIYALCKRHGAVLYLDDAHGTGVLGGGKGALAHFGLKPEPWVIQMGTLSKAFGSFGAFVAAEKNVTDWLVNTARSFMFSTALPAPVVAASLAALDIIENEKSLINKLWENRERLIDGLRGLGLDTGESQTPIVPIMMEDVAGAVRLSESLFEKGIYAPAIRPPTVKRPRLRLTVTASHTAEDIERVIEALSLCFSE